jgi:hypothetical protein
MKHVKTLPHKQNPALRFSLRNFRSTEQVPEGIVYVQNAQKQIHILLNNKPKILI